MRSGLVNEKTSDLLSKLRELDEKKVIYNIHRCKAGWGIIFYYPEKDDGDWKLALSVDKYYPTFEEMVEAEYRKLKKIGIETAKEAS